MKQKPSLFNKISYACGDIYGGGAFLLIGVLYLIFLTDIVGLNPALAGSIFLIGKIWDAISDPMMGIISDRTKSKYGRRRIYFLIGIIPIFVSFMMLWYTVSSDSVVAQYFYYLISYLFFSTTATLVMIPYSSILPAMTSDYNERTSFITIRLMLSNISAIISGVFPLMIVGLFPDNVSMGYLVMGIFFGLFYALPYILLFIGTYENDIDVEHVHDKFSVKGFIKELSLTFGNRSFRVYSIIFIASQTAVDFVVTLFVYYLTYVLLIPDMFSVVLGLMLVVQIISMPIHMMISNKFGKVAPLYFGLPVWLLALIISLVITKDDSIVYILLISVLSGFGCSSAIFVPWSIFPDIAEVDELITGQRREGIYSGLSTLIRKISQAIALFLIGLSLSLIGYKSNVAQSVETMNGIKVLFGLVPIVFIIITMYFSRKYNLSEKYYKVIREVVNGENISVNKSEAISICEEVSGRRHEELKGLNLKM